MGLPGYAGALFVNPAGLAPIRVLSVEGGFSRTPDRSTYAMAAAAGRIGHFNLGFGGRYLRFPDTSSTYDNLSYAGAAVYRYSGIALGASVKYVSVEERNQPVARSLTGDLAVQVAFFDIAALALSAQNLGQGRLSGPGLGWAVRKETGSRAPRRLPGPCPTVVRPLACRLWPPATRRPARC